MTETKRVDERTFYVDVTPSSDGVFRYDWNVVEEVPSEYGVDGKRCEQRGSGMAVWKATARGQARRFVRRLVRGTERYRMTMTREED